MEILILSSLARRAMHAYEVKVELRYKHVRWWAKCEHGHLYATFARLEKRKDIEPLKKGSGGPRHARVYAITARGRQRVDEALRALVDADDGTYFDVDLFLSGAFTIDKREAARLLRQRAARLRAQHEEALVISSRMDTVVPLVARMIMDHRVDHLAREMAFAERAAAMVDAAATWGPFLGDKSVLDFVKESGALLEGAA